MQASHILLIFQQLNHTQKYLWHQFRVKDVRMGWVLRFTELIIGPRRQHAARSLTFILQIIKGIVTAILKCFFLGVTGYLVAPWRTPNPEGYIVSRLTEPWLHCTLFSLWLVKFLRLTFGVVSNQCWYIFLTVGSQCYRVHVKDSVLEYSNTICDVFKWEKKEKAFPVIIWLYNSLFWLLVSLDHISLAYPPLLPLWLSSEVLDLLVINYCN